MFTLTRGPASVLTFIGAPVILAAEGRPARKKDIHLHSLKVEPPDAIVGRVRYNQRVACKKTTPTEAWTGMSDGEKKWKMR